MSYLPIFFKRILALSLCGVLVTGVVGCTADVEESASSIEEPSASHEESSPAGQSSVPPVSVEESSADASSAPEESTPTEGSSVPDEESSIPEAESSAPVESTPPEEDPDEEDPPEEDPPEEDPVPTSTCVAYIPLDNRPVNKDRVEYLAQSVGFTLLMPEEHLYRTALDNMTPNPDGSTIGNRQALLEWVREVDKTCDYFIISLDQMLSGGLVGSRWLNNTDLTFEYQVADEIIRLCENNTVYLFDTVMRLASTVNYGGYQMNEYNQLRSYGQVARKQLYGNDLTVDNIISGYRYDAIGKKISTPLPESALTDYHASRARKLIIADYILRNAGDNLDFLYIGVDDSTPQTTIQSNEIRYLTQLMGDKGVLSAAADELGMCCLARMTSQVYGSVGITLTYYGPGKDMAADSFDIGTLSENIDTHLICLNTTAQNTPDSGLQVLILTRNSTQSDRDKLMDRLEYNLTNNIPTILLDASLQGSTLSYMLFHQSDLPVAKLLGYSSWNTAANAMGIALSQGIARYIYLSNVEESTEESNEGFLKSMTFAYIKDVFYKAHGGSVDNYTDPNRTCSVPLILDRINQSEIITSLVIYTDSSHGTVSADNFRYPWNRTFEMTFDIHVS